MTLNGVMAVILHYFVELGSFEANYITAVEVIPILSATKKLKESNFRRVLIFFCDIL